MASPGHLAQLAWQLSCLSREATKDTITHLHKMLSMMPAVLPAIHVRGVLVSL